MSQALLWNLEEAARQLGDVSTRTVRRMLERGDLPTVRIGRSVRIPAEAVRTWVDRNMTIPHNGISAGPAMRKGESTCRESAPGSGMDSTGGRARHTGGSVSPIRAAEELAAVLELPTAKKRKRC